MERQVELEYDTYEAAMAVGIKVRTMRQWIHDGKIKAEKSLNNPHRWVIMESEIERILNERRK